MTAGIRDKLRSKQRRSVTVALAVADTGEAETALARAHADHRLASLGHGSDGHEEEVTRAREAVAAAQRAEADCYEHVTVTALPADEFEALVDAHPTRDGDAGGVPWHTATFRPALLAACVDADMTEQDWAAYFAESGSVGDQVGLYNAVLEVNTRTPEPSIPKGSTAGVS